MQRNRDGRRDKCFKQLFHLVRSGLVQRGKVRACNLRIGDDRDLGNIVNVRMSFHFHHAHYLFAALGRK